MHKRIHILAAWLVTLAVVTVGGVLPHHHEANGGICFSIEHAHSSSSSHENEGCPLESDFVASLHTSNEDHGSRCGLCDHDHGHNDHQLVLFISVGAPTLAPPERWATQTAYEPYIPLLCASWAKGVSLRAPPVC